MLPQAPQRELSDERDRLRFLLEVNNAVVTNLSLKELLYAVSGWLRKFFPLDFASMVIKDEESGMLKVHALRYRRALRNRSRTSNASTSWKYWSKLAELSAAKAAPRKFSASRPRLSATA